MCVDNTYGIIVSLLWKFQYKMIQFKKGEEEGGAKMHSQIEIVQSWQKICIADAKHVSTTSEQCNSSCWECYMQNDDKIKCQWNIHVYLISF